MRRIAILCLGAVACAAATAGQASAQVQPAGTGEPLYTNSAQNTQWFEWPASQGADAYRIRYDYYENNALKASPTVNAPSANSGIELGELERRGEPPARRPVRHLRPGPVLVPERLAVLPGRPELVLDGHDARAPRVHDDRPLQADRRDRSSRPGADFVKDTKVAAAGSTSPTTSPARSPRTSSASRSAADRRACATRTAARSTATTRRARFPGSAGKTTTFTCTADYGQVADGNVWACVIAADASIPDNPNGPDQSATAEKANLSAPELRRRGGRPHAADGRDRASRPRRSRSASSCRSRPRPRTRPRAWPAPPSGRGATTRAAASGDAVTHTYTQPGTYEVALTVTDAAGNAATAKKTITVAAAGGTTHAAPRRRRRDDDRRPRRAVGRRPRRPRRRAGGADDGRGDEAPSLELDAPRSARARAKSIPVELTASDARPRPALARPRRRA